MCLNLFISIAYSHTLSLSKDPQLFTKPSHTYKIVHCLRHTKINIYKSFQKKCVQVIIGTPSRQTLLLALQVSYLSNRPLKQAHFASAASTNNSSWI